MKYFSISFITDAAVTVVIDKRNEVDHSSIMHWRLICSRRGVTVAYLQITD